MSEEKKDLNHNQIVLADLVSTRGNKPFRIKVLDENNQEKWKAPDNIIESDHIPVRDDGTPYVMNGRPGRKAKPKRLPVNTKVSSRVEAKRQLIHADPIIKALRKNPDSDGVVDQLMKSMAEEAAAIKAERHEMERLGKDTSQNSSRRIKALRDIGDMWFRKKERLAQRGLDLDSPAFSIAMEHISTTVRNAMVDSGLREEQIQTIFSRIAKELSDPNWRALLEKDLDRG